jgi:hypothetical protein
MPSTKQALQAASLVSSAAVSQPQLTSTTASTMSGNKTPQEYPEFIKQALATIEKKAKNLNKRKVCIDSSRIFILFFLYIFFFHMIVFFYVNLRKNLKSIVIFKLKEQH